MKALIWIWQLPQHLLALILLGIGRYRKEGNVYVGDLMGVEIGISLGEYILVHKLSPKLVRHEYGHTLQSRMLGPLYLVVVGMPSITMNVLSVVLWKFGREGFALNYYKRWPESWAERLGGNISTEDKI